MITALKLQVEFTQDQLDKIERDDWMRAGGECICPECGKEYRRHPYGMLGDSYENAFYLTILCDGTLVKL